MISPRKRRAMLTKLNNFFTLRGKLTTKEEYRRAAGTPYRMDQIDKHLHGWNRMLQALYRYYPKWREESRQPNEPKPKTTVDVSVTRDKKADKLVEKMKASAKAAKAEVKDDE